MSENVDNLVFVGFNSQVGAVDVDSGKIVLALRSRYGLRMFADLPRRIVLVLLIGLIISSAHGAERKLTTIPVTGFNHVGIRVSNLERSVRWYQKLFAMPTVVKTGSMVILRVGVGSQYLTLFTNPQAKPGIVQIGFAPGEAADRMNMDKIVWHGGGKGVSNANGLVRFQDPAGIRVRLSQLRELDTVKITPVAGRLPIRDFNHFTIFVPDAKRSVQFYQQLFGLRIDTYQGPMPIIRVGDGNHFLAFVGGRSDAFVHHACFSIENFDPDKIFEQLSEYGLKPRTKKRGPAGPLEYYVTMRMPNRGGAAKGTPELYLTDPDGILLQLQDVKYAGGGGYLGEKRGNVND